MSISFVSSRIQVTQFDGGTATGVSTSTLIDSAKAWTINAYVNRLVWISSGTGVGQTRLITANTSNTLTVSPAWGTTPAVGSVYNISHVAADIVAALPAYCTASNNSFTYTFLASIYLTSAGFLAAVGKQWRFTNGNQLIDGAAGCLFQAGAKLNNKSLSASYYPSLIQCVSAAVEGAYWLISPSCKFIFYGSQLSAARTASDSANALLWFTPPITGDGFEIYGSSVQGAWLSLTTEKDKVIDTAFTGRPNTVTNIDTNLAINSGTASISGYRGSISLRNENGCKGVDIIDLNSIAVTPQDIFLFEYNLPNAVSYLWNTTISANLWTGLARWYLNQGTGHIYRGYTVALSIANAAGVAVTGVTVAAYNTATKAGVILTSKSSYLPVVSAAVNVDGSYTGIVGSGEGLPIMYARYTKASELLSTELLYGPYTFQVRKYGYVFISLSKSWVERTKEQIVLLTNSYVVATQAVAAAYTGIAINTGASNITISASHSAQEIYDYSQQWAALIANATFAEPITTSGSSIFMLPAYSLIVNSGVTLSGKYVVPAGVSLAGSLASEASITGNLTQATPTNFSGVTITGNLTYNTNTPITITFTNCVVTGTISNSGSGLITISTSNSTIGTIGSNVTSRLVTSLNINGLTADSQIYIVDGSGNQIDYVSSSGTSYTLNTTGEIGTWTWKVARYGYTAQTGTHQPAIENTIISITLIIDLFITQTTKATVAAYTTLSNLDRLYDYAAYYETTNSGISYARVINKAGTAASADSYNITLTNTGSVWAFTGSELTINVGTSLGAGSTITGALFTSGLVTLLNAITDTAITANVLQTTPTNLTNVTITGNLTYNIGTSPTVTFTNSTVTGTLSNSGLGTVTITKVNATIGTVGTNIIAQQFASILAPNLLSGSRVRLYNITDLVEIYNGVLTSTGLNQSFLYTGDKTIKLTATYQNGTTAKLTVEANGAFTAGGLQFLNFQEDDLIYNSYAIDGSTISEFEADYVNDQIDLKIATNFLAAELYAWWVYNLTTINGIRDFVGGITAEDESNLRINANIISIKLDNTTTTNLIQIDNIRIYRSDSAYPVVSPETSGGGGIQINWTNKVYTSTIDSNAIATINRNTKLIPALL